MPMALNFLAGLLLLQIVESAGQEKNLSCNNDEERFMQLTQVAKKADKFKLSWNIKVKDGSVTSIGSMEKESGCGSNDQKCSCNNPFGEFQMRGQGTSGTWTGLTFTCKDVVFTFDNAKSPDHKTVKCSIRVNIPWSGSNSLTVICDPSWLAQQVNGNPFPDPKPYDVEWAMATDWYHCDDCNWGTMEIEIIPSYRQGPLPDYTKANGKWEMAGSGGSMKASESVTSSRALSRADAESVAHSVKVKATCTITDRAGAEAEFEVGYGHSWGETITNTFKQTDGTTKTVDCSNNQCYGAYYQWLITSTSDDPTNGPMVTTKTCNFLCVRDASPINAPQCPLGFCKMDYFGKGTEKAMQNQCPCCTSDFPDASHHCKYDSDGKPLSQGPYMIG